MISDLLRNYSLWTQWHWWLLTFGDDPIDPIFRPSIVVEAVDVDVIVETVTLIHWPVLLFDVIIVLFGIVWWYWPHWPIQWPRYCAIDRRDAILMLLIRRLTDCPRDIYSTGSIWWLLRFVDVPMMITFVTSVEVIGLTSFRPIVVVLTLFGIDDATPDDIDLLLTFRYWPVLIRLTDCWPFDCRMKCWLLRIPDDTSVVNWPIDLIEVIWRWWPINSVTSDIDDILTIDIDVVVVIYHCWYYLLMTIVIVILLLTLLTLLMDYSTLSHSMPIDIGVDIGCPSGGIRYCCWCWSDIVVFVLTVFDTLMLLFPRKPVISIIIIIIDDPFNYCPPLLLLLKISIDDWYCYSIDWPWWWWWLIYYWIGIDSNHCWNRIRLVTIVIVRCWYWWWWPIPLTHCWHWYWPMYHCYSVLYYSVLLMLLLMTLYVVVVDRLLTRLSTIVHSPSVLLLSIIPVIDRWPVDWCWHWWPGDDRWKFVPHPVTTFDRWSLSLRYIHWPMIIVDHWPKWPEWRCCWLLLVLLGHSVTDQWHWLRYSLTGIVMMIPIPSIVVVLMKPVLLSVLILSICWPLTHCYYSLLTVLFNWWQFSIDNIIIDCYSVMIQCSSQWRKGYYSISDDDWRCYSVDIGSDVASILTEADCQSFHCCLLLIPIICWLLLLLVLLMVMTRWNVMTYGTVVDPVMGDQSVLILISVLLFSIQC